MQFKSKSKSFLVELKPVPQQLRDLAIDELSSFRKLPTEYPDEFSFHVYCAEEESGLLAHDNSKSINFYGSPIGDRELIELCKK